MYRVLEKAGIIQKRPLCKCGKPYRLVTACLSTSLLEHNRFRRLIIVQRKNLTDTQWRFIYWTGRYMGVLSRGDFHPTSDEVLFANDVSRAFCGSGCKVLQDLRISYAKAVKEALRQWHIRHDTGDLVMRTPYCPVSTRSLSILGQSRFHGSMWRSMDSVWSHIDLILMENKQFYPHGVILKAIPGFHEAG